MSEVTPIDNPEGYFEPQEVEKLIAAATNPRDKLLVIILCSTGIKVSELPNIRIQDIDFDN